jgi:hypothetical protein
MLTCHLQKPWFHTESNCSRNKIITFNNKNTAGIGGVFLCFLSRVKRGIPTIFDHFFIPSAARDHYNLRPFVYPERSEGSLQSSTIFYPEAERGITTIFDFSIPKRSEGSLQSSSFLSRSGARDHYNLRPFFLSRDTLTFVILSGVGAHATTQSKDLCIFFGARQQHVTP